MSEDAARIRRQVIQRLESLERAGVHQVAKSRLHEPATPAITVVPSTTGAVPATIESPLHGVSLPVPDPPLDDRHCAPTLEVLCQQVASCRRCQELAETRTQTVFGVGDPRARLCFMGEAPGADEDRQGEPFVGRAGQLLHKIIEACGLRREEVYILNTIKCRPPGNRNPLPVEAENCRPFLDRQLELIEPEFICCLGAVAAQNLLATTESIGRLRGMVHDYRGIKVVCTYHPAYLLRNPAAKKPTWEDMQLLLREMGLPVP